MGVATHDGHSRQTQSLLGAYHMNDAIIGRHHAVMGQSEIGSILSQHIHLMLRYGVLDGLILIMCRGVMIRHADNLLRTEAFQSSCTHALEGLGRGDLVTIEPVDIQLCGTVRYLLDHMLVPYLVKQCVHSSLVLNLLIQSI